MTAQSCTTSVSHQHKAIILSSSSRKPSCSCYKPRRKEKMNCYMYELSLFSSLVAGGGLISCRGFRSHKKQHSDVIFHSHGSSSFNHASLFFQFSFFPPTSSPQLAYRSFHVNVWRGGCSSNYFHHVYSRLIEKKKNHQTSQLQSNMSQTGFWCSLCLTSRDWFISAASPPHTHAHTR